MSVLSGGERSRVALAKFLIQPINVLLLDEPTNHLDKATHESLVKALHNYDGTIICATHDATILNTVATHVYEMREGACIITYARESQDLAPKTKSKKRKK